MKSKPIFSVILTTYNCIQYIEQTTKSILEQSFKDFELLIIDDFSNDGTYEFVCNLIDTRIKIFQTKYQSGGPALPRNIGLKNAIGNYIAFCDGDDQYTIDHLKKSIDLINIYSLNNFILSFNALIINNNITGGSYFNLNKKLFKNISFNEIFYSNKVIFSSIIMSNNKIRLFSNIKSPTEDYLFVLSNYKNGFDLYYCNILNILYRKNSIGSRSKMNTRIGLLKTKYIYFKYPMKHIYSYPFFLFFDLMKLLVSSIIR